VMSKTLNNGTLPLRFMQNAQRAKNTPEAMPAQATLSDDAEWHVPQNVREMWTSPDPSAATNSNLATVSEPSYLPFLFHPEDKVELAFKGRRSFAHGKEVVSQPEPVQSSDPQRPAAPKLESDSVSGGTGASRNSRDSVLAKPKKEKKPVSISGFKSSASATPPAPTAPGKKPVLPASSLIHQDADVGVDIGSTRRAATRRPGFIKPADVDVPPQTPQPSKKPVVLSIVESARVEEKKRTVDAPSDSSSHPTVVPEDSSRKKRKR